MPDAFTPNLGLTLPEVGASRDTWGSKWNANASALDSFVSMAMPIGAVLDFAGPNAPPGWLICDGRLVSRTTYAALFAVIGTFWGAGDGATNFALPPTAGRASVGPGSITDDAGVVGNYSFSQRFGAQFRAIAQANLPNYAMTTNTTGGHNHGYWTTNGGGHAHTTDAQGQHAHGGNTTTESVTHSHYATTDAQGYHNHATSLPNWGTGAAFGSNQVMSPVFGMGSFGTSNDGTHAHNVSVGTEDALHVHGIYADGNHAHNVYAVGDHAHAINWEGDHSHTVYLGGSGSWFDLRTPLVVLTKIIYAGMQAAPHLMATDAPVTLEGRDELAMIREELALLRAVLGVPQRRGLLAAPMRGSH